MKPESERVEPGPGQESVWDYPRPPRIEDSGQRVEIVCNGQIIVDTRRAKRVLETNHPPVYYVPPEDVSPGVLSQTAKQTFCEWKGRATYYTITVGNRSEVDAAWSYLDPIPAFAPLRGYVAFYPARMDACRVNGERVTAPPGDFSGGWITSAIVGPFKGEPATRGW